MEIFLIPIDNGYMYKREVPENKKVFYNKIDMKNLSRDEHFQSQFDTNCHSVSSESEKTEFKLTCLLKSNWPNRVKLCKWVNLNKIKYKMKNISLIRKKFINSKLN